MADLLYGCVGVDGRRKRKQREFRSIGFTIDGYTDEELRARYRFGKESIEYITDLLADNLRRKTNRNHPLSALQQVLIALRFYASASFLQVVGDTVGVNKSTVSRVVANVSLALVARQQEYVKWPRQQQELGSLKTASEDDFPAWSDASMARISESKRPTRTRTATWTVKVSTLSMSKAYVTTKVIDAFKIISYILVDCCIFR